MLILTMILGLGIVAAQPRGIIDFEKFEGEDRLIAWSEGVASCTTTLKLKNENKFTVRDVCFGIYKSRGTYSINGDTIFQY